MIILKQLTLLTILLVYSFGAAQDYPLSDPTNQGGWILNGDFSDEFEGDALNKTRWHLQGESCVGTPGCREGKWFNGFKGRWPAEFTPDNAWIEEGKLILETRWDPDYPFLDECDPNGRVKFCYGKNLNGDPLPITTAAVNTLKEFTYGYMEIYSKAADAEITSSFWTIGGGAEIDMFEMFGKYENEGRKHKERELKFNMIEWNTGFEPRYDTFIKTDWRVADSFHVYGYEWDDTSITLYIDGVFIQRFTAADFNKGSGTEWFFTTPERLWVDQEVFYWNGLPNEADLPAQFQIEYIRVWQKDSQIEDVTAPVLSNLDTSQAASSGLVSVNVSEQAQLYLVPTGTPSDLAAIKAADTNPLTVTEAKATKSNRGTAGTYILYAIDWAGNISLASEAFTIANDPTASTQSNNLLEFNVYPNPAKNYITVNSEVNNTIKIISSLGLEVKTIKNALKSQEISVTDLASGLYFVSVSSDNGTGIKKLIIQ
ncbi:T9SS type A sorting domain-containing protein [Algibacter mikhailovii]|uniref:T9SS type A sorting domain-containing protein n=1 Tax=Algibacter mikhailovii TaxID=425498 RepID=UPI00249519B0|nr:T9SS type A sorting domain-containing protein [Algibacter mikhailovii]